MSKKLSPVTLVATVALCVASSTFTAIASAVKSDFDGDGKADVAVWRPSNGTWYVITSSGAAPPSVRKGAQVIPWTQAGPGWSMQWGLQGDKPVPGDYSGTGVMECAVFRPSSGTWYIIFSNQAPDFVLQWGLSTDLPYPVELNIFNDHRTDIVFYRPSVHTWYYRLSSGGTNTVVQPAIPSGAVSVIPQPISGATGARFRVYVKYLLSGVQRIRWLSQEGLTYIDEAAPHSDVVVVGSVVGNSIDDFIRFNSSNGQWFIRDAQSLGNQYVVSWGLSGDVPVVADYDGDGVDDVSVWRQNFPTAGAGTFFVKTSSGTNPGGWNATPGGYYLQWGLNGDKPIAGPYNQ